MANYERQIDLPPADELPGYQSQPEVPGVDDLDTEELLTLCKQQFRDAYDQSWDERVLAQQCRDYYIGNQWTADEIDILRQRGQPVIVSNRIFPKINSLIGYEKSRRTDPKAYPRTPKHTQDAEGATDALRFVMDVNNFDETRSDAAEYVMIEGCAACTVTVAECYDGELDVVVTMVDWDRFYRDPHSRRRDFSDAKFLGVVLWMDEDDALEQFGLDNEGRPIPEVEEILTGTYDVNDGGYVGDTYEDRPKLTWGDRNRKRIRVLQHRFRYRGQWWTAILCGGGFLRAPQVSPYLDEYGKPACDIFAVSAFVDRENNRQGIVRHMLSPQDEINKRRSKALHRLTMRQVIAEQGAVADVAHAKRELARPDGWVEKTPGMELEVKDGMADMQGELQLLGFALQEIDVIGPSPSLEGDQRAPSGRAQELAQGASLQEQAVIFDALKHWSWRVYKAAWCRVRQFWTEEKWIRVTDNEQNIKWVGFNRPVTVQMEVEQLMANGQPVPPQLQLLMGLNPDMVLRIDNPVAQMDVDIIVEDGPDTVTVQAEQFVQLVELAKNSPPGTIPIEMIIEASNLRNKDRILEHLKTGNVPPQLQQQLQALQKQVGELQARLQKAESDNAADAYNAQTKRMEAGTKQFQAETDRVEAMRRDVSVEAIVTPQGFMQ